MDERTRQNIAALMDEHDARQQQGTGLVENPLEGHLRYELVRPLGQGGQGFVVLAQDSQTMGLVAIKVLPRGLVQHKLERARRELLNHRRFWHDHVVQFYEVFLTNKHTCIVMEYAAGGSLSEYLDNNILTERGARFFFQQLIFAVKYCHHMGVANRDIKLENALLTDGTRPMLKICDFGMSKHYETSMCRSLVGTPNYLPPEVITVASDGVYDGEQADVWCCGVMLYKMLFRIFPFERKEDEALPDRDRCHKLMERIVDCDWAIPDKANVSDHCVSFFNSILKADPKERITLKGIEEHPWYRQELPPGVEGAVYPERPEDGLQSVEEIERVVRQARYIE